MRIVCLVLLAVACCPGCHPAAPDGGSREPPRTASVSISTQVAAVRTGKGARITADQPLSVTEWESLRGLAGLRELVLNAGVADDTRAKVLATLPDLERLVLRESPLSDAGFRELGRCGRLRDLNVPQAACTPAGIRALATLPRLRSLRLGGPHLAGADVGRAVAELVQLRSLHLIDVPLGDDGLDAIARLPGLWNLYLDGAGVSDDGWRKYFQEHSDVHVHVDQVHHDRDPAREHD
ncbi:MAG: hypothetical protein WCC69_11090 [Pirellulales bacterium]